MDLPQLPREADAVFDGAGVKGVAFAGAVKVAEQASGYLLEGRLSV